MKKPKIISIVGPTSSGKTSLSVDTAKHCNGEVISADSRQVYEGLDIGSGKVTKEEMDGIPHHLLDVISPKLIYSAADFKRDATIAIQNILENDHVPIIAGGTFFYIELLQGTMQAAPVEPNEDFRNTLEPLSNEELFERLETLDSRRAANIDQHNRRRLIRALEIINTLGSVPESIPVESEYEWLTIGIDISKEQLHKNIHKRIIDRLDDGMVEEVVQLHEDGLTYDRMDSLGLEYRYLAQLLKKEITKEEFITELNTKTKQFAKRQITWLKRDKSIEWFDPTDRSKIMNKVDSFLNS